MAVWLIVALVLLALFVRALTRSGPQQGGPAAGYQPGDSPTYAPGDSATYQPGDSPTFQPGDSATYSPGDSPTYAPGDSPTYLPGSPPASQPAPGGKNQRSSAGRRSRRDGVPEAVDVVVVEERSLRPERREPQERQERRSGYVGSTALDNSALSSTLITPYEPSSLLTTLSSTLHAFDAQTTNDDTAPN